MSNAQLPELAPDGIRSTRDALHGYSKVMGDWLKACRPRRKHWWHASLRPSLRGLSAGLVHSEIDCELELDIIGSQLLLRTIDDETVLDLEGQSAASVAIWLDAALADSGLAIMLPEDAKSRTDDTYSGYSTEAAKELQAVFSFVAARMSEFRASIREETSPIQVWPHHFDLSMIWLPGGKIPGQDPDNEEHSDKQMNFGFVFGDDGVSEPYFYITAYPLPEAMPTVPLPDGTSWKSDGFNGAILLYADLRKMPDPAAYLMNVWSDLYSAGQLYLAKT